jgi:hypothetical protein
MNIVGFSIKYINAERNKFKSDKLEIKSNINLEDPIEEIVPLSPKKTVSIPFSFTIEYSPDLAKISLKGNVILLPDEKDGDLIKDWKEKQTDPKIKIPLFNFIMNRCNLKSLMLEEELNLPPHIPFPKFSIEHDQKQETSKKPKSGKNTANYAW